jgi:HK97 family phage portal protein
MSLLDNFKRNIVTLFKKDVTASGFSTRKTIDLDGLTFTNEFFNVNEFTLKVNRGIEKRAQKVSQTKFRLTKNGEEVLDHPILDLLDKPNDKDTGVKFFDLACKMRDISGFAVIKLKGSSEIFTPTPEDIKGMHLMNSSNTVRNYRGRDIVSFTETFTDGKMETTPFNQCVYWYRPDPKNPTEPISLLKAGIYSIDTDNQLAKYQNAIIKNGGNADTIITFKNSPTPAQVKDAKERFVAERRDPKNADLPYVFGADADIKRLGLTPSEIAYIESRKLFGKDLTLITGVPDSILGLSSESTFANAEQDYANFIRETIKPLVDDLVNTLNWLVVPDGYELTYVDPSPEDVDVRIKKVNALYSTDASTINERREVMGLDRIDDPKADEIMVSFAKQPLGYEETYTPTEELSFKKKGMTAHMMLKDKSFREMYRKVAVKRMDKKEAIFFSMIREYFGEQKERILKNLPDEKAYAKSLVDDVFNEKLEIKIAKESSLPLLRRFLIEAGKDAVELFGTTNFDMTEAIDKWINKRADVFAKTINETTFEKLKNQFSESTSLGESRPQLVKRIESVYDVFDEGRAKTIARTETHGAIQKGNYEAGRQSGSDIKIWVSVMDDRTRDSHAYLDGEERAIDKKFSNGLMFAGDPTGDGSETINCRCFTI